MLSILRTTNEVIGFTNETLALLTPGIGMIGLRSALEEELAENEKRGSTSTHTNDSTVDDITQEEGESYLRSELAQEPTHFASGEDAYAVLEITANYLANASDITSTDVQIAAQNMADAYFALMLHYSFPEEGVRGHGLMDAYGPKHHRLGQLLGGLGTRIFEISPLLTLKETKETASIVYRLNQLTRKQFYSIGSQQGEVAHTQTAGSQQQTQKTEQPENEYNLAA